MPTLEIRTPEGITLRREVAGPASRFAAILLDLILITLVLILMALGAFGIAGVDPSGVGGLMAGILMGGLLLVPAVYLWLCGHFMQGQTPGKLVLGLRTVSADGYPASSWQLLLRSVLVIIDLLPVAPISMGIVIAAVTERRQRLGDLVAGTIVVEEPKLGSGTEPFDKLRHSTLENREYEFAPSVGGKLGKRDLDFLRELLTRKGLEDSVRRRLFIRTGKHYTELLGHEGFRDARLFLRELYLFLREARELRG